MGTVMSKQPQGIQPGIYYDLSSQVRELRKSLKDVWLASNEPWVREIAHNALKDHKRAFLNNIKNDDSSGCWLWNLYLTALGYGQAKYKGKQMVAHRLSYLLFKGEIPKDMLVCHSCDNRSCVNPDHLWLGSQKDNMADMAIKKRAFRPKGQIQKQAKLLDCDINIIRGDTRPNRVIAAQYGVTKCTIAKVKRRETWTHISEAKNA